MWKFRLLAASAFASSVVLAVMLTRSVVSHEQELAAAITALPSLQSATSSPSSSSATTTAPTLVDILQQLEDQNQSLASEVEELRSKAEEANLKGVFTRTLKRGDSGDDVKMLQTLLSALSGMATTSAMGFYGGITEGAVRDLQIQSGLEDTGIFDARTRDALIAATGNQIASDTVPTDFTPIDLSAVEDPQHNIQDLQNRITQLSLALSDTQKTLEDLQNQVNGLDSAISNLPPPPTIPNQPLAISNIQVSNITKTSATITWTTNNPSTGEVDYSQSSSMPVSQTLTLQNTSMTTSHSLVLQSLISSVTYYYRIISKDSSNTVANSTNLTFTTSH